LQQPWLLAKFSECCVSATLNPARVEKMADFDNAQAVTAIDASRARKLSLHIHRPTQVLDRIGASLTGARRARGDAARHG
jgi:hypothetical protein